MSDCDYKYTCTPWYVYIVIIVLMLCSTLVAAIYMSYNNSISAQFSYTGLVSSSVCNCLSFLVCIAFLSLLCPTKPGRVVLWLLVICSISMLLSNIIALVSMVNGLADKLNMNSESTVEKNVKTFLNGPSFVVIK